MLWPVLSYPVENRRRRCCRAQCKDIEDIESVVRDILPRPCSGAKPAGRRGFLELIAGNGEADGAGLQDGAARNIGPVAAYLVTRDGAEEDVAEADAWMDVIRT